MFTGKCSNDLIIKTRDRYLRVMHSWQIETYVDLVYITSKPDIHTVII